MSARTFLQLHVGIALLQELFPREFQRIGEVLLILENVQELLRNSEEFVLVFQ
jgi:hypothetical protein